MKYVIELDDEVEVIVTIRYTRGFNGGGTVLADTQYVEGLEPLTPDYISENFPELIDNAKEERDRIVKENIGKAYQQGLVDGFNGEFDDAKAYQKGLEDAWKLAEKLVWKTSTNDLRKMGFVVDCDGEADILRRCSVSEALSKLRAYEQKQKEDADFCVGDEVTDGLCVGVVTKSAVMGDNDLMYVVFEDGSTNEYPKSEFKKTGRHFDAVEQLLEKMKGE